LQSLPKPLSVGAAVMEGAREGFGVWLIQQLLANALQAIARSQAEKNHDKR